MGGDQNDPPLLKAFKTIKTQQKCIFWQKLINFASNFCIGRLIGTIFDPKKGTIKNGFLDVQKGPPFGVLMKKIINVNIFKIFKKKSQKWPTQDLSNIERNKVMKNQPIRGIL